MGSLSPFTHHRHLVSTISPRLQWSGDKLGPWQTRARRRLKRLTGLDRMLQQERCPLAVRRLWRRQTAEGSIEKIRFTVEPGCDALAFVCLPRQAAPTMPWMICLQGHSSGAHNSVALDRDDNRQAITVERDRDFARSAMAAGFAVLALEQRNFGERRHEQERNHTCLEASMQALQIGRTTIAERVYDVDRAIDYLHTRPDVDRKRIGVMGNSGGGTTTIFAAALLPRLAMAMPSCAFCTYAASTMAMHHCPCNYVPGLQLELDMGDILGCFAPKPLVVVAGRNDPIFPLPGVRQAYRQLADIYQAAGASTALRLVIGPADHRFYADLAWPALSSVLAEAGSSAS